MAEWLPFSRGLVLSPSCLMCGALDQTALPFRSRRSTNISAANARLHILRCCPYTFCHLNGASKPAAISIECADKQSAVRESLHFPRCVRQDSFGVQLSHASRTWLSQSTRAFVGGWVGPLMPEVNGLWFLTCHRRMRHGDPAELPCTHPDRRTNMF